MLKSPRFVPFGANLIQVKTDPEFPAFPQHREKTFANTGEGEQEVQSTYEQVRQFVSQEQHQDIRLSVRILPPASCSVHLQRHCVL